MTSSESPLRCTVRCIVPQYEALRFTHDEISCVDVWVTVFSPNNILGLRRCKNAKFSTKVASSMRMMRALFGKSFLIVTKFAKTRLHGGTTYRQKQRICGAITVDSPHATSDSAEH